MAENPGTVCADAGDHAMLTSKSNHEAKKKKKKYLKKRTKTMKENKNELTARGKNPLFVLFRLSVLLFVDVYLIVVYLLPHSPFPAS